MPIYAVNILVLLVLLGVTAFLLNSIYTQMQIYLETKRRLKDARKENDNYKEFVREFNRDGDILIITMLALGTWLFQIIVAVVIGNVLMDPFQISVDTINTFKFAYFLVTTCILFIFLIIASKLD